MGGLDDDPVLAEIAADQARVKKASSASRDRVEAARQQYEEAVARQRIENDALQAEGKPSRPLPEMPRLGADEDYLAREMTALQALKERRRVRLTQIASEIEAKFAEEGNRLQTKAKRSVCAVLEHLEAMNAHLGQVRSFRSEVSSGAQTRASVTPAEFIEAVLSDTSLVAPLTPEAPLGQVMAGDVVQVTESMRHNLGQPPTMTPPRRSRW